MITMIRHALSRERGSVPLALLVVIIMAGLTSIVYARATADQRSVRADNEFTTAIHAAEAGVQEASFILNHGIDVVGNAAAGSGAAGGYAYAWEAVRDDEVSPWVVTSQGVGPTEVSRTVVAELADRPLFDSALATHLGITFTGGNTADSYNSATQTRCSPPSSLSCYGIIASNGNIDMGSSGSANYADRVRIHDWANPQNNHAGRCTPSGNAYCQAPIRENIDDPLDIRVMVPQVQSLLDNYCTSFPLWRASDHATGSGANRHALFEPTGGVAHPTLGNVHCFSELHFDVNTRLPGTVTASNGLIVVVRDHMKIEGHVRVNCTACGGSFPASPNMPVARRLQILTLAEDQPAGGNNVLAAVQIRQHAKLGAAVYAPDASCGNQQSNAQVEIYGSLVCKTVLNQGGWQFHYDEDLAAALRTGEYFVRLWREE